MLYRTERSPVKILNFHLKINYISIPNSLKVHLFLCINSCFSLLFEFYSHINLFFLPCWEMVGGGSLIESGSWCHNLIGGRHMHFSSLWILSSYQPLLPPMLGDGGWGALWIENSIELRSWCHNLIGGRNMHFSFLNSVLVTTSSSPMLGDGG